MTKPSLGRLERVRLRDVWTSEAREFTPWLAQEENLKLLGEVLELELELEAQEQQVGPFRADILCKDTATGNWVLVENQIERTDHNHLGQLLTYAAGLKAVTIVWIASQFTGEHRAALDWLNEVTSKDVNFFGLEIELWKIGDSLAAPKFNAVCKPNEWVDTTPDIPTSPLHQLRLDFWTKFHAFMLARNSPVRPQRPMPQFVMNFSIGRSNFYLSAVINTREKSLRVGLILTGQEAKRYYSLICDEREKYEQLLGQELDWHEAPGKMESHIYVHRPDSDPADRSRWEEYCTWFAEQLEAFNEVFRPVIKNLSLSQE